MAGATLRGTSPTTTAGEGSGGRATLRGTSPTTTAWGVAASRWPDWPLGVGSSLVELGYLHGHGPSHPQRYVIDVEGPTRNVRRFAGPGSEAANS